MFQPASVTVESLMTELESVRKQKEDSFASYHRCCGAELLLVGVIERAQRGFADEVLAKAAALNSPPPPAEGAAECPKDETPVS